MNWLWYDKIKIIAKLIENIAAIIFEGREKHRSGKCLDEISVGLNLDNRQVERREFIEPKTP